MLIFCCVYSPLGKLGILENDRNDLYLCYQRGFAIESHVTRNIQTDERLGAKENFSSEHFLAARRRLDNFNMSTLWRFVRDNPYVSTALVFGSVGAYIYWDQRTPGLNPNSAQLSILGVPNFEQYI